jgi:hypothetical protein
MRVYVAPQVIAVALTAWVLAAPLAQAQADDRLLTRLSEIAPAITACWVPPVGSAGMEMTLRFSLKRNGEINGKPRISFSKLRGAEDAQKDFVASVLHALAACTPLKLSPTLGEAIAGRLFALLFKAKAPSHGV